MASNFETVRPGDVITADLINRIIQKIQELEQKVGTGGGGTTTQVITGVTPPTEQEIGAVLTISGNFDTPLNGNTVTIDSIVVPVASFLGGSGANSISFLVPSNIVIPTGTTKKPVTIRVQTTTKGVGERQGYLIRPATVTGVPTPQPTVIVDLETPFGNNQVEIEHSARIDGTHLGDNPTVFFVAGTSRIPAQVTDTTSQSVFLMVPANIPNIGFGPVTVTVEVNVAGAGQPGRLTGVTVNPH